MAEVDFKVLNTFLLHTSHPCQLGRAEAAKGDFFSNVFSDIKY